MARASLCKQVAALLKRNFNLKRRNKRQTFMEVLLPIYFVLLLALIRFSIKPQQQPAVAHFPVLGVDLFESSLQLDSKLLYVSPDSQEVRKFMEGVLYLLGVNASRHEGTIQLFDNPVQAELEYDKNKTSVAAGIHFGDASLNESVYTIRMGYQAIADTTVMYGSQADCREQSGYGWCPANTYLHSGYVALQNAIETAFIRKQTGQPDFPTSDISVQQMPKPSFTPDTNSMQILASIYFVLAYAPLISCLVVNLVTEKEKKLKEGMRMMGMTDAAFWIAWGLTYIFIIFGVTVVCTFLSWVAKIFQHSNMILFFLLLFLYGLSIISMAFMITPLFDKGDRAGALASFATMLFSLLYLPVSLTRKSYGVRGPISSIPVWGQWLLSLLSPVALALAVDQGVFLDISYGGMNFENLDVGQFPLANSLTMLAVDAVLYMAIAVYWDNVMPSEFGQRRSAFFCFMPSYWFPKPSPPRQDHTQLDDEVDDSEMREAISADLKGKNVIQICNITKTFKTRRTKEVVAVNGLSLDVYEGQITCLLGHNGAGKTTLLNMLTGLSSPTSGYATIYGLDASDPNQMQEIRSMTGVCPQHNIIYDLLTSWEHLVFFAALKGVPEDKREEEIRKTLDDVDLTGQENVLSKNLSGGQKRKLSVAIALIGDPRVIFLDEPTAGMDPYSRRHLWGLLKARRANRVILLTTHFMDEADILADRKAFISRGQLKCVGSSLFLKNRFGVGYHLNMELETGADIDHLTLLVQQDVPSAELLRCHGRESVYALPLVSVGNFPTLFKHLEDTQKDEAKAEQIGLVQFGVSMTTLEEVFLKIGVEEITEVEDTVQKTSSPSTPLLENSSGVQQQPPTLPMYSSSRKKVNLTRQRFLAVLKIVYINMSRNKPVIFFRIVMPVVLIILGVTMQKFTKNTVKQPSSTALVLSPDIYCRMPAYLGTERNPRFVYFENPGGPNASDYVSKLSSEGMILHHLSGSLEQIINKTNHMGNIIDSVEAKAKQVASSIIALYNDTAYHSLPITINVINTALLQMVQGSEAFITAINKPWPHKATQLPGFNSGVFTSIILLGMAVSIIPAGFAVIIVQDRERKIRSQLRISGVTMNVYWAGMFTGHYLQFLFACTASILVLLIFHVDAFAYRGAILALMCLYFFYMPVTTLLSYICSFAFDAFETAQTVVVNSFMLVSFLPYIIVAILDMLGHSHSAKIVHYVCVCLDPPYVAFGGLYYISRVYLIESVIQGLVHPSIPVHKYFEWDSNIPITLVVPLIQTIVFYFVIRVLEVKTHGGDVKDVLGFGSGLGMKRAVPEENYDLPLDEDEDVEEERKRVETWDSSVEKKTPVVMVKNLRKEFRKGESNLCGRGSHDNDENVKVAVRNNSFAVEEGEVFGLLGPNGAGKTTTLNLIIAEEGPTSGRVYVTGYDISSSLSRAFQTMSYCPQHDALWERATLREHIEFYAAVKGIPKTDIPVVANYYMTSLKILEHADKQSDKLSGGTKRKLSYIISLLGEPRVVLLDEPSTGMDPKSKRFLWDTISATFEGSNKGAILTTHYMEEADALCSRVGIMVNGQLECLGSTQHLKNKFGSGYLLEVKLTTSLTMETSGRRMGALNSFVSLNFPGSVVSESFAERASYSLPSESVKSLSQTFEILEKGKQFLGIEEYSFSQSTLEQVFLRFAKHQLDEGVKRDAQHDRALRRTRSLLRSPSTLATE